MSDTGKQVRLRPVIRVFVSSTFDDLKHERDAVQWQVSLKLEPLCARRQFPTVEPNPECDGSNPAALAVEATGAADV